MNNKDLNRSLGKSFWKKSFEDQMDIIDELIFVYQDYEGVLSVLSKLIKINPNRYILYYKRAHINFIVKNYKKAIEDTQFLLQLKPVLIEFEILHVQILIQLGDNDGAKQILDRLKRKDKNNPELNYILSVFNANLGDITNALRYINKAIDIENEAEHYFLHRFQIYFETRQFELALKDINACLELNPDSMMFINLKANTLLALNKKSEAADLFSKLIEIEPDNLDYRLQKIDVVESLEIQEWLDTEIEECKRFNLDTAGVYEKLGDYFFESEFVSDSDLVKALRYYTKSRQLKPDNYKIYIKQGQVERELGLPDKAIETYSHAIDLQPNELEGYYQRSFAYEDKSIMDWACFDMEKVCELDSASPYLFERLGDLYLKDMQSVDAIECYTRAIELMQRYFWDKSNKDELLRMIKKRGMVYVQLQMFADGLNDLEKVIKVEKDDYDTIFHYAIACMGVRDTKKAFSEISRLIDRYPDVQLLYEFRANFYKNIGDYQNEITDLIKALEFGEDKYSLFERLASAYMASEDYDSAIKYYKKILKNDSKHCESLINLANCYCLIGKDSIIKSFNRNIKANPSNAMLLAFRGAYYCIMSDLDKAASDLKRALELDPDNYLANHFYAKVLYDQQKFEEALSYAEKTIAQHTTAEILLLIAKCSWSLGENEKAKEYLNRVLHYDPSNSDVYMLLGFIKFTEQDFNGSLEDYLMALNIDPSNDEARLHLAGVYAHQGKIESAMKEFDEVENRMKTSGDFYRHRGRVYAINLDYTNAIEDFRESIRLEPDLIEAYLQLGYIYTIIGNYDESLAILNDTVSLFPDFSDAYVLRGETHFKMHNSYEAIKDASKALELNPQSSRAYELRADVKMDIGDVESALNDFNKAIEYDSVNIFARYKRASILFNKDRDKECEEELNKIIEINYRMVLAHILLGNLTYVLGRYQESIKHYSNALNLDPYQINVYFYRAEAYLKANNYVKALADYDVLIDYEPDNGEYYFRRGVVYFASKNVEKAMLDFEKAKELGNPNVQNYLDELAGKSNPDDSSFGGIKGAFDDFDDDDDLF